MAPVPAGNKLFLGTHAVGTQNYVCQPSGAGVAYVLFTPQATLFGDDGGQVITHYFSPNPFEPNTDPKVVADGTIRATWQYRDTSSVWAKVHQPNGAVTVDQKAIAWLLLDVVGAQNGPTGGDKLTETTFVQRLNTTGGLAPSTGCSSLTDVGNTGVCALHGRLLLLPADQVSRLPRVDPASVEALRNRYRAPRSKAVPGRRTR